MCGFCRMLLASRNQATRAAKVDRGVVLHGLPASQSATRITLIAVAVEHMLRVHFG
jgi:hypothetical protein